VICGNYTGRDRGGRAAEDFSDLAGKGRQGGAKKKTTQIYKFGLAVLSAEKMRRRIVAVLVHVTNAGEEGVCVVAMPMTVRLAWIL